MKAPYEAPYLKVIDLRASQATMTKCKDAAGDSAKDDVGCAKSAGYCKSDSC